MTKRSDKIRGGERRRFSLALPFPCYISSFVRLSVAQSDTEGKVCSTQVSLISKDFFISANTRVIEQSRHDSLFEMRYLLVPMAAALIFRWKRRLYARIVMY